MAGALAAGVFVAMGTVAWRVWLVILGGRGTVTEDTGLLNPTCGGLPFSKLCPFLVFAWVDDFSFTVLTAVAAAAAAATAAGADLQNPLQLLAGTWLDSREEALTGWIFFLPSRSNIGLVELPVGRLFD